MTSGMFFIISIVIYIKWNNMISSPFPISQVVRQCAMLSPLFYSIYINDLLYEKWKCYTTWWKIEKQRLKNSKDPVGFGIQINSVYCHYCGCPTYAGDMCLLALLSIAHEYAFCWHYPFNLSKSKVQVFGESSISRAVDRVWFGLWPILHSIRMWCHHLFEHSDICIAFDLPVKLWGVLSILYRVLVLGLVACTSVYLWRY